MKYTFEGEGPYIGKKTVLFDWNNIDDKDNIYVGLLYETEFKAQNIYISSNILDEELRRVLIKLSDKYQVTLELIKCYNYLYQEIPNVIQFINTTDKSISFTNDFNGAYIKIEVKNVKELQTKIELANWYQEMYPIEILLMPVFNEPGCNWKDKFEIGQIMMTHIDKLNNNIRFMPPIQQIIDIP